MVGDHKIKAYQITVYEKVTNSGHEENVTFGAAALRTAL